MYSVKFLSASFAIISNYLKPVITNATTKFIKQLYF